MTLKKKNNSCFYNDDVEIYKSIFYDRYDCIILDVNWGIGKQSDGSELARKIIDSKRIPIFIYSGNLSCVEDINEQLGFKKFVRTTPFNKVIEEIIKLKEIKFVDLLGYEGIIDNKILNIFWTDTKEAKNFISNIPEHNDADALTRIITTRIIESLSKSEYNVEQKFFEFYIYPSLTTETNNGDIYKIIDTTCKENENSTYYLIIPPTCQLLQKKTDRVNMLKIEFSHPKINEVYGDKKDTSKKALSNLLTNPPLSVHFIPPLSSYFKIGVIDFNNITSIPISNLKNEDKIATVNPAYMKDIQSCFGQYFSRQGQPNINVSHLLDFISNKNNND